MHLFSRASKALAPLISRRNFNQIRRMNIIAGSNVLNKCHTKYNNNNNNSFDRCCCNFDFQRREFFGFNGNGANENNALSKVYEERRVLGYSPEQLFDVVAAVDSYKDFLPWCQRSEIIKRNPDGTLDAELEIGFKFFVESYLSHVELNKPKSIKTTSSQSSIFDHLINVWEFNPGPQPGTCNLYFMVDFKFQSPLYTQVANVFFKEVVSRLVGSFNDRCQLVYGPGVPVLENTYDHRT